MKATEPIKDCSTVSKRGKGLKRDFKITCICGHFITKNDDLCKLNYYKLKTPTLKKTDRNERIIEESFYYYVCPRCDRDVIVIMRKAINGIGAKKTLIPIKLTGLKAIEYLQLTENNRINKTNEILFPEAKVYSKGIPLSYFKTLSATEQRPRFINEAAYSGDKVTSELIIYN